MFKLEKSKLNEFFSAISKRQKLYLPVDTNGGAQYAVWHDGVEFSKALNTNRSAKDFFFAQTENLMEFKISGKKIEINDIRTEMEDFVIFGVRACDVKSFTVLDNVFLSEPVDSFYKNRREHATIISLACNKPAETCFCSTFGIDASQPLGDVVAYETEDCFLLDAKTEKGNELVASLSALLTECDDNAADEQKKIIKERLSLLPLNNLSADAFGGGKTKVYFESEEWEELSRSCLGCGTCTFVCPTCQCYDIKDFNTGNGIKRFRCWDSCMYSEFTKMSAGQPRLTGKERFRQRFMHKLVYYPENNNGLFGCVGCGRCLIRCPIQMNIVKVMKKLGKGGENNG